jgi:hypothetical protein
MYRTRSALSAVKTTVDTYFAGAASMEHHATRVGKILSEAHNFERPALVTSLDPMSGADIDMGGMMASTFDEWQSSSLGGLGGIPFSGKTGWELFMHRAQIAEKSDLLVVYGCDVHITSTGEVAGGPSAIGAAFDVIEEAGGIAGLDNSMLSERHDQQMAHLLLEVAKVYETKLVAHPEPFARLALANFAMVQSYLQRCIDWGELREGRLAALGGLTIHLPEEGSGEDNHGFGTEMRGGEPLYLPLSFEVFAPDEGALFDLLGDAMGTGGLHDEEVDDDKGGGGRRKRRDMKKKSAAPPRLHQGLLFPMEATEEGDEDAKEEEEEEEEEKEGGDSAPSSSGASSSWWR